MLEYSKEFMVLAGCLNYRTAALELNISQPSLSRHIADLEKELGFQLFERNPLALTSAGRHYVEAISDVIVRLDTAIEQGRRIAQGESKVLSICMVPSQDAAYSKIIYESISRVRKEMPDCSPRFYSSRSHSIYEAVVSGKADVGIVYEAPKSLPENISCDWLIDYPFIAWIHKNNPALKTGLMHIEDLADCKLICSTNRLFREYFEGSVDIFRQAGLEPKYHMKDIEDVSDFLIDLGVDEVAFGSDLGTTVCDFNPLIIGIKFEDPPLLSPTYLI